MNLPCFQWIYNCGCVLPCVAFCWRTSTWTCTYTYDKYSAVSS